MDNQLVNQLEYVGRLKKKKAKYERKLAAINRKEQWLKKVKNIWKETN